MENLRIADATNLRQNDAPITDDQTLLNVKLGGNFETRRQIMIVPLRIHGTQQEIMKSLDKISKTYIEAHNSTQMTQIASESGTESIRT